MARPTNWSTPARRRVRGWGPRVALVALVVGITVAPVPGRSARAAVAPRIEVTAANGYTESEVNFLNYLEAVDFPLVKSEPDRMLYAVGRDSCADFGRGDTEGQVFQTEKVAAGRRRNRMSPAQIGALVPVAVLKLCPVFLPNVTISVD